MKDIVKSKCLLGHFFVEADNKRKNIIFVNSFEN